MGKLARQIASTSHPDSTTVLVVFDRDLLQELQAWLPQSISVIPFWEPQDPRYDAIAPAQAGKMYRNASAKTMNDTDVWVVAINRAFGPSGLRRAYAFANAAAQVARTRVSRDSLKTSRGTVNFSRWVDLPGGVARRTQMSLDLVYADSVMARARSTPKPAPITRPFTHAELAVDGDRASYYLSRLADTTFYSIGGCSQVELVFWDASEKLGQMGPGIVPVLVQRVADPDSFVRERVQEALLYATQDERVLARTGGDYLKFYGQPARSPIDIAEVWWKKFGHFWTRADSTR